MSNTLNLETFKFPIGKYVKQEIIDYQDVLIGIKTLDLFVNQLKNLTVHLDLEQLNYKYRPNGWTIKQVIHHCADSHINSFVRFKLGLTEDTPTVKPYEEAIWATLIDANDDDVFWSLQLLEALHKKWVKLLLSLDTNQLKMKFYHPENKEFKSIEELIVFYAWHCKHHLAHIEQGLKFKGSF
jgi:hypothetical protein